MLKSIEKYFFYPIYWGIIFYIYINHFEITKFIQDDAYTSLRYVKNFVSGFGLVFNIGEKVEGYTNFLWVILLSVVYKAGEVFKLNFDLPFLTQFLSSLFGFIFLITIFITSRKIFSIFKEKNKSFELISFFIPIMILYTTPFIYWSVSGMETSLFATLTLLSIYFLIDYENKNNHYFFLIVSILNSLLRPEGFLFFIMLIVIDVVYDFISSNELSIKKRFDKIFTSKRKKIVFYFSVVQLIYLSFRLIYYGYPLPNTFYAKTEFTFNFLIRGLDYLTKYLSTDLFYGIPLIPTIIRFANKKFDKIEFILFSFGIIYITLTIIIGGDVLPIGRFYIPFTPLIYILFFYSIVQISEVYSINLNRLFLTILFLVSIIFTIYNYEKSKPEMLEKRSYEIGLVTKMKSYAEWINKNHYRNVSVALSTIGAFSFYSDAKVIDIVGLTDEYIAHNPKEIEGINEQLPVLWKERHYNADYVMNRKPDFIIFPAGAKPSAFAECAIFINNEFYENYYLQLLYSDGFNQLLPIFTKRNEARKDSSNYDAKFLKYYINANNLFLSLVKTKNRKLLNQILNETDLAIKYCPKRISEMNSIKGMTFYHLGNYYIAKKYFEDSIHKDSMNTVSIFYLMNTYTKLDDIGNAEKAFIQLKKYSPFAIKDLYEN